MSVVVRLVRDALHADALEAVDRAAFARPSLDVRAELGRGFALLFAAFVDDAPVGYLLAWHVADELEIHDVATHPSARRGGVGRALVTAACAEAVARGARSAYLEVRRGNDAARALYRWAGFADGDVRRGYYDDGEDAVLMNRAFVP